MIYHYKYTYDVGCWGLHVILIDELNKLHKKLEKDIDIVLHYGVEGNHNPNGYHPKGMAFDLHFEKLGEVIRMQEMYAFLLEHWQGGIGIYPHWHQPGFHLDVGPAGRVWYKNAGGEYVGISEHLEKFINV